MANEILEANSACANPRHGGLKITDVIHAVAEWGFVSADPRRRNSTQLKHTYFARCTDSGQIKIGRSKALEARMRELSRQRKCDVVLLASICGGDNEPMYHWWFQEHRLHGEWFAPHPDILAEIERINGSAAA